jgi:hypothetical protein
VCGGIVLKYCCTVYARTCTLYCVTQYLVPTCYLYSVQQQSSKTKRVRVVTLKFKMLCCILFLYVGGTCTVVHVPQHHHQELARTRIQNIIGYPATRTRILYHTGTVLPATQGAVRKQTGLRDM